MGETIRLREKQLGLTAAVIAVLTAIALCMTLGADKAWAGAQPGTPTLEDLGTTFVVSFKDKANDNGYRQYQSSKDISKKISNVKSSNTSVATAEAMSFSFNGQTNYVLQVTIKKTGTTKISFKHGSKKKTVKYVVKSYANPLKSLKIGKRDLTAKMNPSALSNGSTYAATGVKSPASGKVSIVLKKGWKVEKCWYWKDNQMTYFENGAKVPKWQTLYLWVQKGSQREILYFYVNRNRNSSTGSLDSPTPDADANASSGLIASQL